jgi:two-component system chemotaxis response regulator CheB
VLIIDDSLVLRSVVERIILPNRHFTVTGSFSNVDQGLDYLRKYAVDIVLLDIEMPGRSGLDALPDIIKSAQGARVLVLSSRVETGAPAILQALSLGACDTLAKPNQSCYSSAFADLLIERMSALMQPIVGTGPVIAQRPKPQKSELECLAIGSSTGGLPGLYAILEGLDDRIDAPILITQHLPAHFMPFLVTQLSQSVKRTVCLAQHGMVIQPNHIYVAPGEAHLACRKVGNRIEIDLKTIWPNTLHRPAVDPMLASVAKIYGHNAAAIILSGMGKDGLIGAGLMAERNAPVYVQDIDSSVVWGMPGAVARAGFASAILPPEKIAELIADCWLEAI